MKTTARLLIFLLVAFVAQRAAGQATASLVEMDLDQAAFAYDDDTSLLEIYLAFGAATLPFEAGEKGFHAPLPLDLLVLRSTAATLPGTPSEPVWRDSLTLDFVIPDTTGLVQGQYFIHQARVPVPPGEYELRVRIPADPAHGRQQLELRRDLLVPDFSQRDLVGLSDITLATEIVPSQDQTDLFYKNGLLIRPNANQLFGQGVNTLFYYAEAYNVNEIAGDDDQYTLFAYVAEANRPQPLPGLQRRHQRTTPQTCMHASSAGCTPDVLVGTFRLDALPSGSYFLRLALLDQNNESMAEQARKFFVFNPQVERAPVVTLEVSFETSPYATMSEEEVDKGFSHADLIATERERQRAKGIQDLDERRRFLMDFWQKRDPNPGTPINEFREAFYGRLQYANQRYTTGRREGWRTDRGHVFIKYGRPVQIEPHLYERETKPYELWQYNNIPGEGQALFVFADLNGFGDFELIHSTVAGERKSMSWQDEIRK